MKKRPPLLYVKVQDIEQKDGTIDVAIFVKIHSDFAFWSFLCEENNDLSYFLTQKQYSQFKQGKRGIFIRPFCARKEHNSLQKLRNLPKHEKAKNKNFF